MPTILTAAAALNQTPLDWDGNLQRARRAVEMARSAGASILCLPELCLCGYGCEDMFLAPHVIATSLEMLAELRDATAGIAVAVGTPMPTERGLIDAAALLVDGEIIGIVGKQHLAHEGLHYEPRWFQPWPRGEQTTVKIGGETIPMGDLVFDSGGFRLGFEVCEDAWNEDRPATDLLRRGAGLILNPSASHFAFGKLAQRREIILQATRKNGAAYIYANLLGNEAGRALYDGTTILAANGAVVAAGRRFAFHEICLTTATLSIPAAPPDAPADGTVAFSMPACAEPSPDVITGEPTAAWETGSFVKEEEFTRAISLGLFDSMRKSRSAGYVVSLSGGVDSAAVASLAAMSLRFALQELSRPALNERLAYLSAFSAWTEDELMSRLLTTVYQATENSSAATESAARSVAEGLGARFHRFDVQSFVDGYRQLTEEAIGRTLAWSTDDIALQNIQARVRGPGAWMLANLNGALLLATSNRSEAAVGYATMDGDTCGGVSPIAGIDKAFLQHWLRWLETTGPAGLGAIPAVAPVNALEPTAELRPASSNQTDEDDLMPYPVLDQIERLAIHDKLSPCEIFDALRAEHDDALLLSWIVRFHQLWCRNQWKRERYAPSFHVDDANLDPKTWCRFPILSGGFARELRALQVQCAKQSDS